MKLPFMPYDGSAGGQSHVYNHAKSRLQSVTECYLDLSTRAPAVGAIVSPLETSLARSIPWLHNLQSLELVLNSECVARTFFTQLREQNKHRRAFAQDT